MNAATALSLPDTIDALSNRKGLIGSCALGGAILAFIISLALPTQYQADGSLVVRSQALTAQDNDAAFNAAAVNEAVVTTEQEVLTSRGLLSRVARKVDIPPAMLSEWSLNGALIGLVRGVVSIGGSGAVRWFDGLLASMSPPPPNAAADLAERRIQFLTSAVKVTTTKGSSVLKVKATTREAQLSADIVNQLQQLYTQDRLSEQTQTATLIEQALKSREETTKQQISSAEDRLTNVLSKPGAIEANEVPGMMRDMSQLGIRYAEAQAELARRQSEYNTAMEQRAATKGDPIAFADAMGGGRIPLLRQQYDNAQQEIARMPTFDTRAEVSRASVQRQLGRLQSQIAAEANRIVEQRRTAMLAAQQVVAELDREMGTLRHKNESQAGATIALERERGAVASLWRTSDAIESRLIDLAARPANSNARILTVADAPTRPSFPSKSLFAMAGLVLGTVAAGGYTLVTSRVQGLRLGGTQLAERLNAPFLGGIPRLRGSAPGQRRLLGSPHREEGLAGTIAGVVLELEKEVRRGEIRSLLVTSGRAGEGKTTVATGLTRAMASLGLEVLLVDLDLRRPRAEAAFAGTAGTNLEAETRPGGVSYGLDVKVDRATGVHILTPYPTGSDPLSTLRSEHLHETLEAARQSYDVVILDTPPVLLVPDAIIAAKFADAILLVTEFGRTDHREIEELSRRLGQTGRPIHGVIATKVEWDDPTSGVYMGYG
jgi:capsular exopolysaccharide synthesis family protein